MDTFPMNAEDPPKREIPTATLAGAPPAAFLNAGDSASETPFIVGTKSISISPKHTTRESSFPPLSFLSGKAFPNQQTQPQQKLDYVI